MERPGIIVRRMAVSFGLGLLAVPSLAAAQAYNCAVPRALSQPHVEGPTQSQPKRILPIGGYTLAISWAPQHCRYGTDDSDPQFECAEPNAFGFVLHGLWPDGKGPEWPQYCRPAKLLPQPVIRKHICATPSAQLLQHEYAKHGTCTRMSPSRFFATSTGLFGKLRYPDMQKLSRETDLTAGRLASAIAAANPRIDADMMRITADKEGWLEEIWFCLDTRLRYRACPAFETSLPADRKIRIWRPKR